ncbi:DUF882 domain-containing protein [Allomesorhizobium camelthorni]|uniref:Murein endopeptidase K n=1 Tax=Allomesorhizobium camelthorni TaxID=475069 RepID=A0A6G4WAZ1_9HYPH|nr:DUF882 domain-containing protein [Mesorhizobium camelthorni]NGO51754.1 DUF882 domain-containing protein [Mesorhizobium camelthorni]
MLALSFLLMAAPVASAETRTLKLYFIHTKEKAEITFKRNGRYDQSGLNKINRFLRDWRRNEPTRMDPRLLDLVWETYKAVGARDYIHVVSAYRSSATNSMLRKRSKGVANKSQHMLGKAMDFYIPGVSLKKLRDTGLRAQGGGVGYYPRSGSPFVHMDVGNVRHWPRMSRSELASVFPNGKTLHVPTDGKPLPGFETALASYKARSKSGATALALASSSSSSGKRTNLFAAIFGGGADEEEESSGEVAVVAAASSKVEEKPQAARKAVAEQPQPQQADKKQLPGIQIVSPDQAQRTEIPQVAEAEEPREETPETIIAALPARSVPVPMLAPRPDSEVGPTVAALAEAKQVPFGAAAEPLPEEAPAAKIEQVPFGVAAAPLPEEAPAAEAELAPGIPLPTRRPDYAPPAAVLAKADVAAAPVLLAMASADEGPMSAFAPLPSSRPSEAEAVFDLAAVPATRPEPASTGTVAADSKAALEAVIKSNGARVAALATTVTPRAAVASRPAGTDAASALDSGVKTTRKSPRPSARDTKPDPKPVVVAAQPQAARWVLHSDYVTTAGQNTTAPSFAYNIVRTAPRAVYTAGFQQGDQVADANRFSGKAVKFLSVARFQ